ncbi:hypothetical protein Tco_0377694 [Tanacetum coccineum]
MMVLPPKSLFEVSSCVFFVTEQTEESFSSNGNLNREWAVRPDGSNSDAIPEEATSSTIFPSARKAYIIVFHKNVFPVPPWL